MRYFIAKLSWVDTAAASTAREYSQHRQENVNARDNEKILKVPSGKMPRRKKPK